MSVLFRLPCPSDRVPLVALAAGLGVLDALVGLVPASNLGIKWPDSMTFATPTDANGQLPWKALRDLTSNDLLVTPVSATINLKLQDTYASLLASPRIRVRHKEKALILIGD